MATDAKEMECVACGGVCVDKLLFYGKNTTPRGRLCEPCWRTKPGEVLREWTDRTNLAIDARQSALSPGRALTADGSVRVNEEQAEAMVRTKCVYASHGPTSFDHKTMRCKGCGKLARELGLDVYALHRELVGNARPVNEAARLRNIAALAAELSKPAQPRFPAEGRSDRALSVTNGVIRGRE